MALLVPNAQHVHSANCSKHPFVISLLPFAHRLPFTLTVLPARQKKTKLLPVYSPSHHHRGKVPNALTKYTPKVQLHELRKRDLRKAGYSMVGKTTCHLHGVLPQGALAL